ncbi:MAG: hypothetical protein Q8Q52_06485, partial [Acidimicrobiia bacterium]|nr:hypothetical protein [Acidimicrobiia bacterium]
SGDTIFFAPEDAPGAGPQAAAYEATLTFGPETATNPVTTGKLEYDQFENDAIGFEAMQWCEDDPYVTIPGVGASIEPTLIPDGQTWCIVSETTIIFSGTKTQTTWEAVGVGDPKFR